MSSSPWAKIETPKSMDFAEIMSEELARDLQDKENKKFGFQIHKEMLDANSKQTPNIEEESEAASCQPEEQQMEIIPDDVLKAIQEANGIGDFCESDAIIAQVLQAQFDLEYDAELKVVEKHQNKDAKVKVSYSKYRLVPDGLLYDSDEEKEDDRKAKKKDWDRFETVEKEFGTIPKCGYKLDEDGEMITKHDERISGVRNACRVMSFPPEFPTGDGAGFDMKLSNKVFNQLKSYSRRTKKHKMHDRRDNAATAEMGIDEPTRLLLYKLINNQILEQVNGIISTGKEAVILHADTDTNYSGELILPKECAIKIFKTTLNEFKQRDRYIKDDYRFKDRFSKQNNRTVINMWAEKEMHNLMRMQKAGINCPVVVILKKHVLVMSFIGDLNCAAPKLKDAKLSDADIIVACHDVIEMMHKLYKDAHLVHADLSEYNILYHNNKCWFIDVAQSIEPGHPSAFEYLMRDCGNITNFFTKRGVPEVMTKEELFSSITGLDSNIHNAAMLERLHNKGAPAHIVTSPYADEMPDEIKPLSYPFDYAWDKSQESKGKSNIPILPTESLKSLKIANATTDEMKIEDKEMARDIQEETLTSLPVAN